MVPGLTRYVQHVNNPAGDPVIAILVPPAAWEEKINTPQRYPAIRITKLLYPLATASTSLPVVLARLQDVHTNLCLLDPYPVWSFISPC